MPPPPAEAPQGQPSVNHWPDVRPIQQTTTVPGLFVFTGGEVEPADIAGEMPTIEGVTLDTTPRPALSIPSSGTWYVEAQITGTHVLTGSSFARDLSARSVTLVVSSTMATSSNYRNVASGGTFRLRLATFVNGVKTSQNGYGPISCDFYDDGSNTGKLTMLPIYPGG